MRIQIFVQSLSIGGAERVAALWANGFIERGHEIEIVLFQNEYFPRTYEVDKRINIRSIYTTKKGRFSSFVSRFCKTGRIIHKFHPDVILTVYHVQDIPIWFFTRGSHTKIISTEHNAFERPSYAQMSLRDYLLKYYSNRLFDAVTVLTKADALYIGKRLKHVYVLPNPLAFPIIKETLIREKVILAVGRLDVYFVKGFDILIRVWGKLFNNFPDWKLRIVGSAPEGNDSLHLLQELAVAEGVSQSIEFLPYRKNLLPLYQQSEIFVLSSRFEGFGLVLIEAMSQGCACIACDYKGRQKEIIESKEYGLVCQADDMENLFQQLHLLLSDGTIRIQIQENAPKRAEQFANDKIMHKWNDIFNSLM